ncbi:heme oxygenase (biliverdin-producing) [Ruania halotolerans]|uniref:biliverdin-producing heme oxygenase n=1 Tax=Ruania halotolerans TaxID=2897773 RepID=UPI001E3C1B7E|nr:biliverdin-producing heme oxygenase [Ruania halotolerans]UFU06239.1 biliverdin-producing heme oxygenase [Ruania halotolerans]
MSLVTAAVPVSTLLREATAQAHERAENTGFVQHLISGRLTITAFTALVAQHHAIYTALEALGSRVRDQRGAEALVRPELARTAALARDLAYLTAEHPVPPALAATRAYVARLDELDDLPCYAAHAYTRYLGDLSGGQIIKTMMQRHYGMDEHGLSFYTFEQIEKIPPYKAAYRAALDALDVDEEARTRLVAEARAAFAFNEAVFTELGELHPPER